MKSICIFAGSNTGNKSVYAKAATDLADAIADQSLSTVFGGGKVGLMGVIADRLLSRNCSVIGVIPQALFDREAAHSGLTELIVVDSMHTRKATMAAHADAFVALPGGMGTLEELFEVLTWLQLGFHSKPCGILNANGYYDDLLSFLDKATDSQFIKVRDRSLLIADSNPTNLLAKLGSN